MAAFNLENFDPRNLTQGERRQLENYLLQREREEAAEWTLNQFVREAWHVIEPGTQYVHGWHIDAICEHLTALFNLIIQRLVINMPPRHAKSSLCSVLFNGWVWTKQPASKFLCSSYAQPLSTRDSLKTRRLIQSKWYQQRFGHIFQLTSDQRAKTRFDNSALGYRISTSVGGVGTGEGGDYIIADDPNNAIDWESEAIRDATIEWWDGAMSTRGNDPKTVRHLIIQQRTGENDLTGHVSKEGGYETFILPAEYEKRIYVSAIGWNDPRQNEGELLWPERFDADALAELKRRLGTYRAAGQLQQRPAPRGGGIIQNAWWGYFEPEYDQSFQKIIKPAFDYVIQVWDTAFKDGEDNDYSVCLTIGVNQTGAYIIHRFKAKLQYPALLEQVKALAKTYNPNCILIEDKASGQSLNQSLRKETRLPVKAFKPDKDKVTRLTAVSSIIESGRVFLLKGAGWVDDFIYQLGIFPAGAHDDDVDALSMGLAHIFFHTQVKQLRNVNLMGR